ncbi:MAG: hypothetical protein ACI4Q3_00615 [Kiritimatiellia bacterium]
MAWYGSTGANAANAKAAVNAGKVDISRDTYTSVVREESIAVGYFLTTEKKDENGNKTGEKVTEWHQTGVTVIVCKVQTDVKTWEYRGLTKELADYIIDNAATYIKDGTEACNLSATFGGTTWTSGQAWVGVGNCVGTIWHVNRRRVNEAGGYAVTVTKTTNTKVT